MTKPDRKKVCTKLLSQFGTCECKRHCAREQYTPEEAGEHKPRGRYSVCEIEAQDLGIWQPPEEAAT